MALIIHTLGPGFGLPDPSPFCMKALTLMKMSGLNFETAKADFRKAPKGKVPYLKDDGRLLGDSSFIRRHLETKHNVDFTGGMSEEARAVAYACERMCEEQLYWIIVAERWGIDRNFENGPKQYFEEVPAPARALVAKVIRRSVRKDLKGHGMGRHTRDEQMVFARDGAAALSGALGDKPFFAGDTPCGEDAGIHACIASLLCTHFDSELPAITGAHDNLVAYNARMMKDYYPDFA